MIQIDDRFDLEILIKDEGDQQLVVCFLKDGGQWRLTPHQARILAGKLIAAVNQAEVRYNLKHEGNLSRNAVVARPATGAAGSPF